MTITVKTDCPACGSVDTVNPLDKPIGEGEAVRRILRYCYPDARTCVDCGITWSNAHRPVQPDFIGKAQ